MTEIDVQTSWDDSGFDCDHCGGRILTRTDSETGQPARVCYQCEFCGCQWTLNGDVLRVGHADSCRSAQSSREASQHPQSLYPVSPLLLLVVGVLLLLILVFVGGLAAIRFLIPIAIASFVFLAVFRVGRERMWW